MPKIAKPAAKAASAVTATALMEARQFNPINQLMDIVSEEIDEPENEATLKSMLCTDYEPGKPGKLRLRARLRAEILMELARYQHPRLKATETVNEVNLGVVVEIKNYAGDEKPVVEVR